jgi:SNF2-related domain/SNF2 Helicase protein/Helicase conserved C-terminal domain
MTKRTPTSPRPQTVDVQQGRLALVASYLVDSGKVVPSLAVDGGGVARSCWAPLPATGDRDLLAALLDDDTVAAHGRAANALADAVDQLARERLAGSGLRLVPRRSGRRTVPQAWLESLTATDPALPAHLPADKVAAFATRLDEWTASGAVARGRGRLCLRVHEPGNHPDAPPSPRNGKETPAADPWWVEVLLQDAEEPSLVVPIADFWAGGAPFPAGPVEDVLRSLARMAAVAPEVAGLLDRAAPTGIAVDMARLLSFVDLRVEPLAEIGVSVLLPSWWSKRRRVALRARASSSRAPKGVVTEGGLGFDQLITFKWEVALGDQRLSPADLRQLERAAEAKQPLVQLRGEWVQVDATELRALLAKAGSGGQATAGDLVRASLGLASLTSDGGDVPDSRPLAGIDADPVDVVATGWLGHLLADVHRSSVEPHATPESFRGVLRPYQERGVGWLVFLGRLGLGACLADDMGLGKTAQLIATLLADPDPDPTLVICPVSVLGNWARELERFAPELRVLTHHGPDRFRADETPFAERAAANDVVLSTYSLVARDTEHLSEVRWSRVVLDEAQQIKNPGTKTARSVRQLDAARRVALTGTPVENRLAELWSIMQFLNPGLLGSMTSFTTRFAGPIERDSDEQATDKLQRLVGPFLLRRLKTDKTIIDDLPDKIEQTEHTPLTREQASLYQAVVDDLLLAAASEEGIGRSGAILGGIAKLKQVCNHPAHFLRDGSALSGRSGKLDRVEELLDEIIDAGDKVLCFTQFAEWGNLLVPHLARRYGTEPLWLHGGVPRHRREEMMASFQDPDGPPIFLLSLKAGGTGLNLTAASHVIHLDRWWNPAVEDQATDRAYRIGQRRTVLVHKLVSAGTIEERIDEMIVSKRALAQRVVGSGEQWITKLDTAALRDVVSLRDTEVV